jgi:hypothetical protein
VLLRLYELPLFELSSAQGIAQPANPADREGAAADL